MKITGAQALMKCLKEQGVDVIFGFPGGAVIDIYDELLRNEELTHVLVASRAGSCPRRRCLRPG